MNKPEAIAGTVVVLIGAVLLIAANKLPYTVEHIPGPGFLPLWVSFGIIACGAIITFNAARPALAAREAVDWPDATGWRLVGVMLAALAVALLLLETLGFFVVATVFMAAVIFSLGVRSWRMLVTVPLVAAGGLYLVFAVWLRVPLPQGLLSLFD